MTGRLMSLTDRVLDRIVPKTHAAAAICWSAECCKCEATGCFLGHQTCCANGNYFCGTCYRDGPRC